MNVKNANFVAIMLLDSSAALRRRTYRMNAVLDSLTNDSGSIHVLLGNRREHVDDGLAIECESSQLLLITGAYII